jgi:hypothetical protein
LRRRWHIRPCFLKRASLSASFPAIFRPRLDTFSLIFSQLLTDIVLSLHAAHVSPATDAGGGENISAEHDGRGEAFKDGAVDYDVLLCTSAALMVGGGAADVDLRQKSVELVIAIVMQQQQQQQQAYTAPPCLSNATALLQSWLTSQVR